MRKVLNLVVAVLLLGLVGVAAWLVRQRPAPEPVYQGQPLSYWLGAYDSGPTPPTEYEAHAAIRGMGTNALPALLRMIQEPTYGLKDKVIMLLERYHVMKPGRVRPRNQNFEAFSAFQVLGPTASNALPQLIAIFDRNHSAFPQQAVPAIIAQAGPAAQSAVPTLLRGATHTNAIVRNNSIFALGCIHAEPAIVVPVLTKALNDPDALVRMQAASALGRFGTNAESAVPALLALYHREKPVAATNAAAQLMNTSTVISRDWSSSAALAGLQPNVLGASWDALEAIDPDAAEAAASGK